MKNSDGITGRIIGERKRRGIYINSSSPIFSAIQAFYMTHVESLVGHHGQRMMMNKLRRT